MQRPGDACSVLSRCPNSICPNKQIRASSGVDGANAPAPSTRLQAALVCRPLSPLPPALPTGGAAYLGALQCVQQMSHDQPNAILSLRFWLLRLAAVQWQDRSGWRWCVLGGPQAHCRSGCEAGTVRSVSMASVGRTNSRPASQHHWLPAVLLGRQHLSGLFAPPVSQHIAPRIAQVLRAPYKRAEQSSTQPDSTSGPCPAFSALAPHRCAGMPPAPCQPQTCDMRAPALCSTSCLSVLRTGHLACS